jgi:hypothetical protein
MGLKDSLKRLFSTSKKVGTEKVEQSIDQAKEFAKEHSDPIDEVVTKTKESIKDFAREANEKVMDLREQVQEKTDETKDNIEAKIEEIWAKVEDKAVVVVDKLEAKIRGKESVAESTSVSDNKIEAPTSSSETKPKDAKPITKKPKQTPKA